MAHRERTPELVARYLAIPLSLPRTVTSAAGGSDLTTVSAFLLTPLHVLNIAGATLTPTPNICILTTPMDRSSVDLINQNYNIACTVQNGAMDTSTNGGVVQIAPLKPRLRCAKSSLPHAVDSGTHNQPLTVSCHLPHIFGSMMFQGGSSGGLYLTVQNTGTAQKFRLLALYCPCIWFIKFFWCYLWLVVDCVHRSMRISQSSVE